MAYKPTINIFEITAAWKNSQRGMWSAKATHIYWTPLSLTHTSSVRVMA